MSVKLDNFISIDIKKHLTSSTSDLREVAVLFDAGAASELYYSKTGTGDGSSAATPATPFSGGEYIDNYFKTFFENGGKILHVVNTLSAIPQEEIVIGLKGTKPTGWANSSLTGPDQKIWVEEVTATSAISGVEGQVAKYVPSAGAAMGSVCTVLAYYTQFKIYSANSAKGYNFTAESVVDDDKMLVTDNTDATACMTNHLNYDMYLANSVRNIGGDDVLGNDLTNLFMRIVLQQFLTARLVILLASKIKYDARGVVAVSNTIANELNRFVANGYINSEKIWEDEDLYIDNELIVSQGSPLTGGYTIHISGFDTLTASDRAAHKFPQVYILYGDSYDIRKIVIKGEVF